MGWEWHFLCSFKNPGPQSNHAKNIRTIAIQRNSTKFLTSTPENRKVNKQVWKTVMQQRLSLETNWRRLSDAGIWSVGVSHLHSWEAGRRWAELIPTAQQLQDHWAGMPSCLISAASLSGVPMLLPYLHENDPNVEAPLLYGQGLVSF